jgi:hypothetical protein
VSKVSVVRVFCLIVLYLAGFRYFSEKNTENIELRHFCTDRHNWIFIGSLEGGLKLWFSECLISRYPCSSVVGSTVLSECVYTH